MKAWPPRGHLWNETRHEKGLCDGVKTPKRFSEAEKAASAKALWQARPGTREALSKGSGDRGTRSGGKNGGSSGWTGEVRVCQAT